MATPLYTYQAKTEAQIRDDILRSIYNGLYALMLKQGITNPQPNVSPNSDYFVIATAFAREMAVVQAGGIVMADRLMPDTATGTDLDRWLALYGLAREPGAGAYGNISVPCSVASTLIPVGSQLTDPATGFRFQVTVGGTYTATGGVIYPVPVQCIEVGASSNKSNGAVLQWVAAPAFCQPTATVGAVGGNDGLTGGIDSEVGNDEAPRARLIALLQNAPKGGNWIDVTTWAAQSSPYVDHAYDYPALQGGATTFFTVTRAPQAAGPFTSTSKNRDISSTIVNSAIVPYVQGQLPEHVYCIGASALNQPTNVALLLSLPSSPTASPPGPGGGWTDGSPWPSTGNGALIPNVFSVGTTTFISITVPANTPGPTAGATHISYIDPNTWTLYTATILTASVSSNVWTVTLDTPFPNVTVGSYIFPASVNQQNYLNAVFQAFANLGPGEWTANTGAKARAFRHPPPSLLAPYTLDANFLRVVENAGQEVLSAAFVPSVGGGFTTPNVPTTINVSGGVLTSNAPAILVPANIGFYAA